FSLMVGTTWDRLIHDISKLRRGMGPALVIPVFAVLVLVWGRTARSEARNNLLLGQSSRIAEASLQDMRQLFPDLGPGTNFLIIDDAQADLNFHHADGGLFRLAYRNNSLHFEYSSSTAFSAQTSPKSPDRVELIYSNGHLSPWS